MTRATFRAWKGTLMSDNKDDKAINDEELDEISGGTGVRPEFQTGHGHIGDGEGLGPDVVGGTGVSTHHDRPIPPG